MTEKRRVIDAGGIEVELTQEDIDEARRLGLSGKEMLARAIRRHVPNARRVEVSDDLTTATVDTGPPLD
jgi:hypothetical protein